MLLQVSDLSISFHSRDGSRRVVSGVEFSLERGRTLGIVGESGSGKSVSTLALMGLLPRQATVDSGRALFAPVEGQETVDLLSLGEEQMRRYRGKHIAMIFQEPMTSLNPLHTCGAQVVEMMLCHQPMAYADARKQAIRLFDEVQLPDPERLFDSYPHQISGGQKQRVMIAMALACNPDILIADEPTTALDVMVQRTILDLLRSIQAKHNIAIIFISHDLGVIAQVADDVAVMYHGTIVERGPAEQVLHSPSHPYTKGLLACRPPLDERPRRLPTVQQFLDAEASAAPAADEECHEEPDGSCQEWAAESDAPIVSVRHLSVTYVQKRNFWGRPAQQLKALDDVSFDLYKGETLALVGGSGCGKTTLGRALLRLIDSASGSVLYRGIPLNELSESEMRRLRPKMQIIFQDPYSSLNPRLTIGDAIMEPLRVHHLFDTQSQRREYIVDLLGQVGLPPDAYNRYPHQFSGGQRQRVCIARTLALQPELVVCDESVSALDVSVQAQVLNLLSDLKERHGYTYLFITHDLSVVHFIANRILVMQQGRIVEEGMPQQIFDNPQHPYTQQLIAAIPRL